MKGNWQLEYGAQEFRITWDLIILGMCEQDS